MANLNGSNVFSNVYQLESNDDAQAGAGGIMNRQAQALVERTGWLKEHLTNGNGRISASGVRTVGPSDAGCFIRYFSTLTGSQYAYLPASASFPTDAQVTIVNAYDRGTVYVTSNVGESIGAGYFSASTIEVRATCSAVFLNTSAGWTMISHDYIPGPPVGSVILMTYNQTLAGYLPCDGSYVDMSIHYGLYQKIGTSFGVSGTNFRLPNYNAGATINGQPVFYFIKM